MKFAGATSILISAMLSGASAESASASATSSANPIRRVVNLLASMQQKVTEAGKKEEDLFDKFMCYCKTGVSDLEASISDAEAKLPQVTSALKEAKALKEQLEAEIKQHKADRGEAEEAISKATALREKEASVFAKESADFKSNINALTKAIAAIEKGAQGSFLQTQSASRVKKLVISMEMSDVDRDVLSSFLSQSEGQDYAPQSGQITGILKQMLDTMKSDLAEMTSTEEKAIADFEALVAAKNKEINTNQMALESKLERVGEVGVEIETLKGDIADTSKTYDEDKTFLAELKKGCSTKEAEYEERVKTRNAELLAIGDTIKILNDDDALELFKKTLPAPTLIQTTVNAKEMKRLAMRALGKSSDPRLELIAVALKGHTKGFEKVLKMIDNMVELLGKEQVTDDDKKAYCEKELDKTEDDLKELEGNMKDLKAAMADAESMIKTLTKEIADLTAATLELDKQVKEATAIRKQENEEYEELIASDTAAKELMKMAKNRLAKFYAPKLYKPPPKQELSAAGRIEANFGGAASLVQVHEHTALKTKKNEDEAAPPPPPETWGAYKKKTEDSNGVIAMIDMLIADLDKEMTVAKTEETEGQAEYEEFMADAKEKKASNAKSIEEKRASKADMEAKLEKMDLQLKSTTKEAFSLTEVLGDLHAECDWLLQNYDSRKAARAGEIESLKNAKAVLSGADFALMQTAQRRSLRGL